MVNFTHDSDEAFARFLQEQEDLKWNFEMNADLELAKRLQNEEVIDLTNNDPFAPSSSKPISNKTRSNNMFNRDSQLAKQLGECENGRWLDFDSDRALARKLETEVDDSILDDEIPDLHRLFVYFNRKYFDNRLDMVEVRWSTKMTRCAGTCTYKGANYCIVTLSEPLLKFRTKKDMFETLLHEMIHALLFVTNRNTDHDGHGPEFLKEAKRISDAANVNITVYHDFHSEVKHYLVHVWKCNGPCKDRSPYYGTVKRSMNRPPQKADIWFEEHQRTCGGTFIKVAGPPPKEKAPSKRKTQSNTLENYFVDCDEKMKKLKEF